MSPDVGYCFPEVYCQMCGLKLEINPTKEPHDPTLETVSCWNNNCERYHIRYVRPTHTVLLVRAE